MYLGIDDHSLDEFFVEVGGTTVDVGKLMEIDEQDMSTEFAQHSALVAYWGAIQADLERRYAEVKQDRERMFADRYLYWRTHYSEHGVKFTESMLDASVKRDELYMKYQKKELEAKHRLNVIDCIISALRVRGDMLISLGATLRHEYSMTGSKINAMREVIASEMEKGGKLAKEQK